MKLGKEMVWFYFSTVDGKLYYSYYKDRLINHMEFMGEFMDIALEEAKQLVRELDFINKEDIERVLNSEDIDFEEDILGLDEDHLTNLE